MGYIYKISNLMTNEIYVGKTLNDINERFNQHISNGRKIEGSSKIAKSLRLYGSINHKIEVLEVVEDENLLEREQFWIDALDTLHTGLNIKNEKLQHDESEYAGNKETAIKNMNTGEIWNKGISPTKETKQKISHTKKKRSALGLYSNSYGHTHTEETRKLLSEIAKRRPSPTSETRKKIGEQSKGRSFYYNSDEKKRIFILSSTDIPTGYKKGKGLIWMKRGEESISIDIWDKQEYLKNGYCEGR